VGVKGSPLHHERHVRHVLIVEEVDVWTGEKRNDSVSKMVGVLRRTFLLSTFPLGVETF